MNRKLNSSSMLAFVVHGMIGIELITMPLSAVRYAKSDAWMAPIIASAISLIICYAGFWICSKYPGLNFAQINEKIFGKVIGKGSILMIIAFNIFYNVISLRLFAETINTFLLEKTPMIVTMILFIAVMVYCMKMDIQTISIVFNLLLPVVLFFVLLLILLCFTALDIRNLRPVYSRGIVPIIKSSLNVLTPSSSAFVFTMILPYFHQPKSTKKYITIGVIIGAITYTIIVALCIMVFGDVEITELLFPTLVLSKSIQMQTQLFERAESLFMTAWIPNAFTTLMTSYLASTISLKALFNTEKNNLIILLQAPVLLYFALLPKNIAAVFQLFQLANTFTVMLGFTFIPLITLAVFIKKGRRKSEIESTKE